MPFAILLLAAAGFTVLTTEFLIVGLLPALARDLGVGVAQAGLLVSLFALVVALSGPLLTARFAGVERRRLFVTLLLLFGAANLLAALAPDFATMAVARLLPALGVTVFWSMACETAVDTLGPAQAGRALALMAYGMVGATVFGIPLGTLLGDAFGWRWAFALLALLAFVNAALLTRLPTLRPGQAALSLAEQLRLARQPVLLGHVLLTTLSFTGMFTAYTYLADLLERLAGLHGTLVGWALMVFGAVGLIGNGLGGRLVDKSARRATLLFSLVLALGLLALVPAGNNRLALVAVLGAWGIAQAALFIIHNARLMQATPEAPAFGSALNIAGANAGIALGALLGGRVIDTVGHSYLGVAAALIIGVSMLLALALMPARSRLTPTLAEHG